METVCDSEDTGEECSEVTKRVEEDVVEEFNNCREKESKEMCATINCKVSIVGNDIFAKHLYFSLSMKQRNVQREKQLPLYN